MRVVYVIYNNRVINKTQHVTTKGGVNGGWMDKTIEITKYNLFFYYTCIFIRFDQMVSFFFFFFFFFFFVLIFYFDIIRNI